MEFSWFWGAYKLADLIKLIFNHNTGPVYVSYLLVTDFQCRTSLCMNLLEDVNELSILVHCFRFKMVISLFGCILL